MDRLVELAFAATSMTTMPEPVPPTAPLTVVNADPVAVRPQVGPEAVTVTAFPGAGPGSHPVKEVGEIVNEQPVPNCVTE